MAKPTSTEPTLASSARTEDWRDKWQHQDAWTVREFAQLCCGWNPSVDAFPNRDLYNEALESINRAVRAKVLPTLELLWPATAAERLYNSVPMFGPHAVASWAAKHYPDAFPYLPDAWERDKSASANVVTELAGGERYSTEPTLASSARTEDWHDRWQHEDAWTVREFAQLCCGWNPSVDAFPNRDVYNEALESINRAVRVKVLPTIEPSWPMPGAERLDDSVPMFKPHEVASWAAKRYRDAFPYLPDAWERDKSARANDEAARSLEGGCIDHLSVASAECCVEFETEAFEQDHSRQRTVSQPRSTEEPIIVPADTPHFDLATHDLTSKEGRRAAVDAFLACCNRTTAEKIHQRHIWKAMKHRSPRQFQYWLALEPKPRGTIATGESVRRILKMTAPEFLDLLRHQKHIPS